MGYSTVKFKRDQFSRTADFVVYNLGVHSSNVPLPTADIVVWYYRAECGLWLRVVPGGVCHRAECDIERSIRDHSACDGYWYR